MKDKKRTTLLPLIFLLIVPAIGLAQAVPQARTLVVNGQSGQVQVVEMNGRSYIDLESLARIANGSLGFSGDQITLTLPAVAPDSSPTAATSATAPARAPASNPGFSKGFLRAAIEAATNMREWHAALASAIQSGFPLTPDTLAPYRAQTTTGMRLASVAITTGSDQSAFQLLTNEFNYMKQLSDKYLAMRANLTFISPNALQNDSLNQTIVTCGHSLAAMAASGQFVDDGSCN
jgi:hypothetical protein